MANASAKFRPKIDENHIEELNRNDFVSSKSILPKKKRVK